MSKSQKEIVEKIFLEFIEKTPQSEFEKLDSKYFFSHKLWIWSSKVSLSKILTSAGINPDCILSTKRGLYKKSDSFLLRIINELEEVLGRDNLNWNSMENFDKIIPPKSLRTPGRFTLTDEINFPLKKISPGTILMGLQRTFKMNWSEILSKTNRSGVKRKESKYSDDKVFRSFITSMTNLYNCSEQELMSDPFSFVKLSEVKSHDKRLTSLLNKYASRVLDKSDKKILRLLELESDFVISLEILSFYWNQKSLVGINEHIKSVDDFKTKTEKINIIKKRKNNDKNNQKDILLGYSNGYFGHGDFFGDKTLYRYINHMKGSTDSYFKKIGIEIKSLSALQNKLNRKYNSRDKILNRLRELVGLSVNHNSNYLTREWLEENDPELIKDSFIVENIKTNSWERVLRLYGLNPMVWNNSYPTRSYRGFVFEKSVKRILSKYLKEVEEISSLNSDNFIYNKLIDKGLRPDFVFKNIILDTKFSVLFDKDGVISDSVSKQMEKYSDYFQRRIIILTLNQGERILKTHRGNYPVELIDLKVFQKFCKKEFSLNISDQDIKDVFENINSVPFWKSGN